MLFILVFMNIPLLLLLFLGILTQSHLQLSKQYFTIKSAADDIILRENEISLHIYIHKYMNVEINKSIKI